MFNKKQYMRKYKHEYRKLNREKLNQYARDYYSKHPEKLKARSARYYKTHRERMNAYHRQWYRLHHKKKILQLRKIADKKYKLPKNVYYCNTHMKYKVQFQVDYTHIHCGWYDTEAQATVAAAYYRKKLKVKRCGVQRRYYLNEKLSNK